MIVSIMMFFFFSSRRRHTRLQGDWSSDVCSSDLAAAAENKLGMRDGAERADKELESLVINVPSEREEEQRGTVSAAQFVGERRTRQKTLQIEAVGDDMQDIAALGWHELPGGREMRRRRRDYGGGPI